VSQQVKNAFVVSDSSEIVQALVGLKGVRVVHYRRSGRDVELMIEQVIDQVQCSLCGGRARVKERPIVRYVDLPVYATPMRLAWRKHRMHCPAPSCPKKSFVVGDHRIAATGCLLTTRAAKWATAQVGGGRTVAEVAAELDCDWHTINDTVTVYGQALLAADRRRLNTTTAIGLDETSFVRLGQYKQTTYATTVADVENHQIIDILPSRSYVDVAAFIDQQSPAWKARIAFGALDMSATYAAVYTVMLPKVTQVIDAFHVIRLANRALDAVRRRVQNETTGHRGRRGDPLYRARRVLLMGEERLDPAATARLASLLELGDPGAEVAIAYRIKERLRDFYQQPDPTQAHQILNDLRHHCQQPAMPPEIGKLGRTLNRWFTKIMNYHLARVSNGPTEALNNLIKRIKRIGFGFRNFDNYRIRVLLYAGKPNWRLLGSIVVQ
jgi:transposase